MNTTKNIACASFLAFALVAGCGTDNPSTVAGPLAEEAIEVGEDAEARSQPPTDGAAPSEASVLPASTSVQTPESEPSTRPLQAWKATAELLGPAGPSDYYVATNPADLASVSDYVVIATVGPPSHIREFATAASPDELVYSTVGFPLIEIEAVDSPYVDRGAVLSGVVIAEVVAPVGLKGLDHPALRNLPAESRAIFFANEFTDPGQDTHVSGTIEETTYIAPAPQGFVIEAEGVLVFVQNESLASDYLTKELGLKSLDDVVDWLNEGVNADREPVSD